MTRGTRCSVFGVGANGADNESEQCEKTLKLPAMGISLARGGLRASRQRGGGWASCRSALPGPRTDLARAGNLTDNVCFLGGQIKSFRHPREMSVRGAVARGRRRAPLLTNATRRRGAARAKCVRLFIGSASSRRICSMSARSLSFWSAGLARLSRFWSFLAHRAFSPKFPTPPCRALDRRRVCS